MLKNYSLCLLFLLVSFCAKSQQRVEYGFQAGLNLNSAKINDNPERKGILPGLNIGSQVKVNFTRYVGLKMMLQYEQKGYIYKNLTVEYPGNGIGKASIAARMNYIDLKILPVVTVGRFREFYLYGGPTIGFLVVNKLVTKFKDPLPPGEPSTVTSKGTERNSLNFGIALGIGTQLPIGQRVKISFDVRSDLGLSNVYKDGNVKLRSFSYSPGILFTL